MVRYELKVELLKNHKAECNNFIYFDKNLLLKEIKKDLEEKYKNEISIYDNANGHLFIEPKPKIDDDTVLEKLYDVIASFSKMFYNKYMYIGFVVQGEITVLSPSVIQTKKFYNGKAYYDCYDNYGNSPEFEYFMKTTI